MMSEDFRSGILQEFTNMRAAMEGAGRKVYQDRTKCTEFTPFSLEDIDIYLGLILANDINMKPQTNFWFLLTHNSIIYGNTKVI